MQCIKHLVLAFALMLPAWVFAEGVLTPIANPPTPTLTRYLIRADTNRVLPNDLNLNAIFNVPTNGRLTLPTGVYRFEMLLMVNAMSATSGNARLDIKGAGTATMGSWIQHNLGNDLAVNNVATPTNNVTDFEGSAGASVVTATTGTELQIYSHGTFEVTTAGTVIPSIDLVTAAAANVVAGTYFMCESIGAANVISSGPWD